MLHVQWKTDVFPFEPEQIYREIFVLLSATKMKAFVMTSQVTRGWLQGQITDNRFYCGEKERKTERNHFVRESKQNDNHVLWMIIMFLIFLSNTMNLKTEV